MSELLAVPVLDGTLVTLRPHRVEDVDAVLERCVDPDSRRFTTIPLDYTRQMAEEYVAGQLEPVAHQVSWAIEVRGSYAGTVDLRVLPIDAGGGSLGFVTHPAYRGRGVMSDAVRLVVAHAFDTLGWQLVQWRAHAGNWGSAKTVWRNGFPVPTFVPDFLVERGRMVDGWISTLHTGQRREPVAAWEQVYAALAAASAS
ncbi:GNAT family N-acetyltransferase [Nostocoides sp. HKS02]|uniref:GNAT family N-acetyltransferase n=1 Tax=Nostocoides sp. HKS02 TaxID=1813880 RepID=UPI0012B447A4|nr:GNAT family N-acetyltransferase [Tetrasphaera sp. HKS02]QGN58951.1 GNAT family N-acetyltransferase [Tetrasphaera sp. HKS02]